MSKQKYVSYIAKALEHGRSIYGEGVEQWKKTYDPSKFLGMYMPPGNVPVQAKLEGFMYYVTGDMRYAEEAKKCLLDITTYQSVVPEEHRNRHPEYAKGIPSMDGLFQAPHYIYGYLFIKDSGIVSEQEKRTIEHTITTCIEGMLHYPEWGAHNRSMLRVWALSLAIEAIGLNDETAEWDKMRRYLAEESVGHWSIEDAELYLSLWLMAGIEYAKYTGIEKEFYEMPQTRFYFDFISHLITPSGQIPDFGDAHFMSCWDLWVGCLEKGAAVYQDGRMKYLADKVSDFGFVTESANINISVACYLVHAYLFSDESLVPVKPEWGSEEVLEDVIGKKIVFRDKWDISSPYMMLTYRDEGNYAAVPRNYLKQTIDAKAEKTHHGHSDENSVSALVKDGNVLLVDGGYREQAPNGKYRNDIYHNRLVFRDAPYEPSFGVYDYLHDSGTYKQAVTEKLHFQKFAAVEYSRTRLYDPLRRMTWDRLVTYLKKEGVFVIADWTRSEADQAMTTANLWHTGTIQESGQNYFDTYVSQIHRYPGDKYPYNNLTDLSLLIEFPGSGRTNGSAAIKRAYGDGTMIYEIESSSYAKGGMNAFVTVLTPKSRTAPVQELIGKVKVNGKLDNADTLSLTFSGTDTYRLAYKLDLEKGLLDPGTLPRYTWEASKIDYGDIVTDADFAFVRETEEELQYGFVNGCRIALGDRMLFAVRPFSMYQFATSDYAYVDNKWKAWDGKVTR